MPRKTAKPQRKEVLEWLCYFGNFENESLADICKRVEGFRNHYGDDVMVRIREREVWDEDEDTASYGYPWLYRLRAETLEEMQKRLEREATEREAQLARDFALYQRLQRQFG
jgi:guanylate kinase